MPSRQRSKSRKRSKKLKRSRRSKSRVSRKKKLKTRTSASKNSPNLGKDQKRNSKLKRSQRSKLRVSRKTKTRKSATKKRSKHMHNKCIAEGCQGKSVQGKRCCVSHQRQYGLDKPKECPICLEKLGKKETPWPCGHFAHRECIAQGMKAECPLCRDPLKLTPEEIRKINQNMKHAQEERGRDLMRAIAAGEVVMAPHISDERLRRALINRNAARARRHRLYR